MKPFVGLLGPNLGSKLATPTNKTLTTGPFGNNLRSAGYSLTRSSVGGWQNQVSTSKVLCDRFLGFNFVFANPNPSETDNYSNLLLTVLDLPTFRGSPRCEVPTRPHIVWCGSPIRYNGLVAIILKICLNSCLSVQESGLLSLARIKVRVLGDCKCLFCQWFFHHRGRGWEWVPSRLGEFQTLLGKHNRTCIASDETVHTDAEVTTHKGR